MRRNPFILLCGTGLFAIFSSTISKSPVLPLFAAHLGAQPAGIGAVAAVSSLAGIVASIPAGLLSDRLGRRRLLAGSAAVFATAPFLYLLVGSLWQLALLRFYHGLATAIFVPVAMALVADLYSTSRGEKLGWFSTATLVGRFVAPLAGGAILGLTVAGPVLGYRLVYLVCGVSGAIALLLLLLMPKAEAGRSGSPSWAEALAGFRELVGQRVIILTALVDAAILFSYGAFETFLPIHALKAGISPYGIGFLLAVQVLTLALVKPLSGSFSDRHGRRPQILAGALLGAAAIAVLPRFEGFVSLLAVSVLFGLSLAIVTPATAAFIGDLSHRQSRGSAMGILGSVMDIGHTAGPLATGALIGALGYRAAFLAAALILTAAALSFFLGTCVNEGT